MGNLDGDVAIVTGASRGIGAGIAHALAQAGARVVLTGRNEERARSAAQQIVASGGQAIGLAHDVTRASSCAEVMAKTRKTFGPVSILVNNAGISQRIPFREIDEATWDHMVDVNLKSVYLMVSNVLEDMIARKRGCVVNIASLAGKAGAAPLFSHYVASKFAVVGLTQALAAELAPHDILVNAVCPGVIRTDMWEDELKEIAEETGASIDSVWKDTIAEIPLGRPQDADDIGHAVAFLASNQARNITGETININGGQLMD